MVRTLALVWPARRILFRDSSAGRKDRTTGRGNAPVGPPGGRDEAGRIVEECQGFELDGLRYSPGGPALALGGPPDSIRFFVDRVAWPGAERRVLLETDGHTRWVQAL